MPTDTLPTTDKTTQTADAIMLYTRLHDLGRAMNCLLTHLPQIDPSQLPEYQRQGFDNAVASIHLAIHAYTQRVAAITPTTTNPTH